MTKLLFTIAFAGAALVSGQTPQRLTLAEAEQLALKQNPSISSAELTALAARETPTQLNAARYPVVSAGLTGAGASENSRLAAGALNNPVIYSRVASGLSINQLLLDFGRTSNLVAGARQQALARHEDADARKDAVVIEVNRAYFEALRTEAVVRVAKQTVAARQLVVDQVEALAKARLKSGLDVSFANVNLAEAQLLVSAAENQRRAAHARLSAALGLQTVQEFELVEEALPRLEPLVLSDFIQQALLKRPDLRARRLEADAFQYSIKAEKAAALPSVSAMASTGWIPERSQQLPGGYSAVGLVVNLPVLNGGLYKSRQAEARLRARAAEEQSRELENQIVREIAVALSDVNTASERLELTARLLEQASQALELAQARYDLGLSSIVELSQAQLTRTTAEIQNTNAQYEYQILRRTLDYHAGIIR
jgi:outer membrane protein